MTIRVAGATAHQRLLPQCTGRRCRGVGPGRRIFASSSGGMACDVVLQAHILLYSSFAVVSSLEEHCSVLYCTALRPRSEISNHDTSVHTVP